MEAMGLTLDGEELRVARLRKRRGRLEIVALERVLLTDGGDSAAGETEDANYLQVMGLAEPGDPEPGGAALAVAEAAEGGGATAIAEEVAEPVSTAERTLHNTLFRHAGKGVHLGMALEQEDVSFTTVANPEERSRRRLKRLVREELTRLDPDLADDAFDCVPRNGQSVLAFSHSGSMELLNRVRRVNDALPDPLRLALVDVSEVALMNLVTRLAETTPGMSVLIYVGHEFSRLLFFRDGGLHDLSPVIHEGVSALGNLSQCYGRIVAELDVAGVDALDNVYVAGAADVEEYRVFFQDRIPGCQVEALPYADALEADADLLGEAGAYALPISLAWKVLDGRRAGFSPTNFLPAELRRGWLSLALSWHGWALLTCCVATLVVSAAAAGVIRARRAGTRADTEVIEALIAAATPAAQQVDQLGRRIAVVHEQSALVDSLRPSGIPSSELVRQLTEAALELNSMWLTDLSLSGDTFSAQGISLYGNRIHRFAETQDGTAIHSVTLTSIMEKTLYQYDISGPVAAAGLPSGTDEEDSP